MWIAPQIHLCHNPAAGSNQQLVLEAEVRGRMLGHLPDTETPS